MNYTLNYEEPVTGETVVVRALGVEVRFGAGSLVVVDHLC